MSTHQNHIKQTKTGKATPTTKGQQAIADIPEATQSKSIKQPPPIKVKTTADNNNPNQSKPITQSSPIKVQTTSPASNMPPNLAENNEANQSKPITQSQKIKVQTTAPWLGEIPAHWEVRRFKYLFTEINERSPSGNEDLLSVSQYTGVTLKSDNVSEGDLLTNASTLEGYKKVSKGDLVSNIMLAWNGSLGFSPYNGITSPAYSVYRLAQGNDKSYFHYLVRTDIYKAEFKRNSSGVIESRLRLYTDDFYRIISLLPPLAEQTAIAQFLDRKTALIDQAIGIKEKQIALLQERRQILIHRAVTRGLNPNAPLKPSGVEWIGDIPEGWEVKKLKYISEVQSGVTLGKMYNQKNLPVYPYLRVANVQSGYFKLDEMAEISLPVNIAKKYFVKKGDILVTEGGDLDKLGRGTVWNGEIENCLHQNHIFAIRVNQSFSSPEYASMIMESDYGRRYFTNTANKTTNLASTNAAKLGNFPLILPALPEQASILEFVKESSQKIATAISLKQQEIEKLKEYKATLINSAVTGKINIA